MAARGWRARGLAAVLGVMGALLVAEVGLRVSGRGPIPIDRPSLLAYFWRRDARLGFRNRPDGELRNARAGSLVRTGRFGERLGVRWQGDLSKPAVLFVGDSTTFCGEVNDDETCPSEVAKRLPASLDVACVNLGVCGYNTIQTLRMTEEWLERVPARLVVYTYCDNDYLENVDPLVQRPAVAPHAVVASGAVKIVDVPVDAGPWGEPVGADPAPSFPQELAALSALYALRLRAGEHRDPRVWGRGFEWAETRGEATRVLDALVLQLRDLCARRKVPLLVTRFTTGRSSRIEGYMPNTQERIEAACRAANVTFVDLQDAFPRPGDEYRAHFRGGIIDPHYSTVGTRTYGEALAPRVAAALGGR